MKNKKSSTAQTSNEATRLPTYVVPQVTTYTDEEILEVLGPAQANTSGGVCLITI